MLMAQHNQLTKQLFLQTTDGSQCVTWNDSQLTYLGKDCKQIPDVLIKLYGKAATRVDFSFCSLTTLKGLEAFVNVRELILDNNALNDATKFPESAKVTALSLNKNKFQQIDSLLHRLAPLYPNLRFLSLIGNPGHPAQILRSDGIDDSELRRYRQLAIHLFPKLNFLDSRAVTPDERQDAFKRAQFVAFFVKPTEEEISRHDVGDDVPLVTISETQHVDGSHHSAFGKLKYRYTGKHSEGNRFIRNSQL